MKRKRNLAFIVLIIVLVLIIVMGAFRWRSQMRGAPSEVAPAPASEGTARP